MVVHVGYSGFTLLVPTQAILPQLMFWSTMCRLKALSYMTRQIKADHKIRSPLVGHDSSTGTSQQSCCFPQNPRKIRLSYYTSLFLYTDAESVCWNCGAQIFNLCNAVEQFQQVAISWSEKHSHITQRHMKFLSFLQESSCLGVHEIYRFQNIWYNRPFFFNEGVQARK